MYTADHTGPALDSARSVEALALDPIANCANGVNLRNDGRAQSLRLTVMFDNAGIPFDAALTSPLSFTREAVHLAFGKATVVQNLTALEIGTQAQGQGRTEALTAQPANRAGKGHVALVTHRPNIDALTTELAEDGDGIAAQIQPRHGRDGVGRIRP